MSCGARASTDLVSGSRLGPHRTAILRMWKRSTVAALCLAHLFPLALRAQDTVVTRIPAAAAARQLDLRRSEILAPVEFGQVSAMAVTASGGVVVADSRGISGLEITLFDSRGRMIKRLGSPGEGPGEHGSRAMVGTSADGTILVLSRSNSRVLRYDERGQFLGEFPVGATAGRITGGRNGQMMITFPVLSAGSSSRGPEGRQRIDIYSSAGRVLSTVGPQESGLLRQAPIGQLDPQNRWTLLDDRRVATVATDDGTIIFRPVAGQGRVQRIEFPVVPSAYAPGEREELVRARDYARSNAPQIVPNSMKNYEVPLAKGVYAGMAVAVDGLLWMRRRAPGVRIEPIPSAISGSPVPPPTISFRDPLVYSGFTPTGEFLGTVTLPTDATMAAFGRGVVWAVLADEDGLEHLARFTWR